MPYPPPRFSSFYFIPSSSTTFFFARQPATTVISYHPGLFAICLGSINLQNGRLQPAATSMVTSTTEARCKSFRVQHKFRANSFFLFLSLQLWASQASGLVELRQQILTRSQEIMELSRQLQASQLQTGYTISQNISDTATPRAPPQVSDAVHQIMDYSQRIAGLSQQLRVSQSQTMQSLPSPPVSPRDVPSTRAMSNSPFFHAVSQKFFGGGGVLHKAPKISGPMQLPQQIMNHSQQIADLSRQLRISQSQSIQVNRDLSQMPPYLPLQQNFTNSPFPYPVPQNARYSDPFHSQSPYPFYPTAGNNSAYYPVTSIPSPPMSALEFAPKQWAGGLPNGFLPQPVSAPLAPKNQPSGSPAVSGYHQYGDCGESLPLAVMTNLLKLTGRAEIRSISVFTTRLRSMAFVLEDGPIMTPVRLRDPCLNCENLMQRLPGTVNMLAASGWSRDISWVAVNQSVRVPGVLRSTLGTSYETSGKYEFSLSAAYGATREEIYSTLEVCTLANANPFIFSADIRRYLTDLWYGFVVPYRYVF